MKPFGFILAVAALGLIGSSGSARAQGFYFSSTFTPATMTSGGSTITTTGQTPSILATAPTDIVVANLVGTSTTRSGTDTFNNAYSLTVTLNEDTGSGPGAQSISKVFTGTIGGTFSQNSANLTNTFDAPTSQLYTFSDGQQFLVALGSFAPPGAPGLGSTTGSISAHVTQTAAGITPEPGSLALMLGLGASGSWITYLRRRRRV